MNCIAADPVDANWRILQEGLEKQLTPRGRSRLSGHRRTRGHEVLQKHDGSPKRSGRRFVALARATIGDIEEVDASDEDETIGEPQLVVGYSRCARKHVEARAKEEVREQTRELRELDARLHTVCSAAAGTVARRRAELEELLEFLVSSGGRSEAIVAAELKLFDLDIAAQYAAA